MDTTLIIIAAIAALLIILYLLTRRPGATIRTFDPERPGLIVSVTRRTTIVAPSQNGHAVQIALDRLVGPPGPAPAAKGLGSFVVEVIHPTFTDTVTDQPLSTFSPPLTVTVNYTAEDAGGTSAGKVAGATPNLTLGTYYMAEDGWRFQKLDTSIDPAAMTLTAQVSSLTPADPIGIWH